MVVVNGDQISSGYIFRWSQSILLENWTLGLKGTRVKFRVSGLSKWEDGDGGGWGSQECWSAKLGLVKLQMLTSHE